MSYEPLAEHSFIPTAENISQAIQDLSVPLTCERDGLFLNARNPDDHKEVSLPPYLFNSFIEDCGTWDAETFDANGAITVSMNRFLWDYWLENYENI